MKSINFRFFPINNYRIHQLVIIFPYYFCYKPKEIRHEKILFILFTVQFVLAPHITKSYSVNSIEDRYEYSIVNQEKKTVKKDILGNTIIEDDNGNKITIKKIFWEILLLKVIMVIRLQSKRHFRKYYY